jgi:D-3-phosphoglycerate dehydrogenase
VPFKVLVATRSFGSTSDAPWDVLHNSGCELVKADMSQEMSEDRLIRLLEGVEGAVIGVFPMTSYVMENAPALKVISMHGVGTDHIDLEAASRLGIVIANCPGTNDQAVADLTIGLIIAVARNIPSVDNELRAGTWGRQKGSELWKKTLGMIGFGRIGSAVAKRAIGFDMRVLVYDPYVEPEYVIEIGASVAPLEDILAESDYLSLHAALTAETKNMIGSIQFERMKPSAFLINTARGGLVDEDALHDALINGKIAGAAMDVFVEEPLRSGPLLELKNVVLTPHIGAHTVEAIDRMGVMAARNVVRTLQGGQPISRVV